MDIGQLIESVLLKVLATIFPDSHSALLVQAAADAAAAKNLSQQAVDLAKDNQISFEALKEVIIPFLKDADVTRVAIESINENVNEIRVFLTIVPPSQQQQDLDAAKDLIDKANQESTDLLQQVQQINTSVPSVEPSPATPTH